MTKTIMYVHGLSSSGNSRTAKALQTLLPNYRIVSPDLPVDPGETLNLLKTTIKSVEPILIIGTSMGGMFTQLLRGYNKILINPAFHVSDILKENIGTLNFLNKRINGEKTFEITEEICCKYRELEKRQFQNITQKDKKTTWAMFGKDDTLVNCLDEYVEYYSNYLIFEGDHRISETSIENNLLPLIREIITK